MRRRRPRGALVPYTTLGGSGDSLLASVQETANTFGAIGMDIFGPDGTLLESSSDSTWTDVDQPSVS